MCNCASHSQDSQLGAWYRDGALPSWCHSTVADGHNPSSKLVCIEVYFVYTVWVYVKVWVRAFCSLPAKGWKCSVLGLSEDGKNYCLLSALACNEEHSLFCMSQLKVPAAWGWPPRWSRPVSSNCLASRLAHWWQTTMLFPFSAANLTWLTDKFLYKLPPFRTTPSFPFSQSHQTSTVVIRKGVL